MNADVAALTAHADWMPAYDRAALAASWADSALRGTLLLATCHRVELYGDAATINVASGPASGARLLRNLDAVRHMVTVAVGRDSAVVGEDQILHQLRAAARHARVGTSNGGALDRAIDVALRAGRQARSWLPANRPTLVDLALERAGATEGLSSATVFVVGAGQIGSVAARTLTSRGATLIIASRTPASAKLLADRFGARDAQFDPGPELLGDISGVIVALSGPWQISDKSRVALTNSGAWMIDLSSPPAVDDVTRAARTARTLTIDDLAHQVPGDTGADVILRRLDRLIDETVEAYAAWAEGSSRRTAARALAERAASARSVELEHLWQRLPTLDEGARVEVARMAEHLTERLLRDPLEQLAGDPDGRRSSAARDLFRL